MRYDERVENKESEINMTNEKTFKLTENGFIKIKTGDQEVQTYFYHQGDEVSLEEDGYTRIYN